MTQSTNRSISDLIIVVCADNTEWASTEYRLVGSVKTVRSREINKPACVGQFPVFVDKNTTRMFTYSKKIKAINKEQANNSESLS